jgi:FkbH-like protein
MILRPEHFAARRINWNDKAANLREIATELNIGVDSLAFMDDNPVERQWVRRRLPEVTVIDLPVDPGGYASALRDSPVFERLVLTEEDLQRGQTYAQQRARTQLQSSAGSLEDFYRSLEMEVEIAGVTPANLARVAQLTQKTNQFNLTTRRYTERQIADLAAVPGCRVYAMSVADRLGDNGLVGVAITRDQAQRCEVETFLLSCRVIGRTVETALLAQIAQEARQRGAALLGGFFLPTWKNAPARDFFKSHGFSQVSKEEQGSYWELDLAQSRLACPDWIKVKNKAGGAP